MLPHPLPQPPRLAKPDEPTAHKRAAPDDEDDAVVEAPPAKRARTNGAPSAPLPPISPSKRRKLDEDGILLLDSVDEKVDEHQPDVIEID